MRENILNKHLKNFTLENHKVKDAFIMGVDGLLIAILEKKEDNQRIAAQMAGVIDAAKRMGSKGPVAISVIFNKETILAVPLSENFVIIIIGTKSINSNNIIKLIDKNKQNIINMIEKREFNDLFSFSPREVDGLDL